MNLEIQKQLGDHVRAHVKEIDALFLWFLHQKYGFAYKRLKEAYTDFAPMLESLCNRYEMSQEGDDVFLCTRMLKEIGVDLDEWDKEVGE